MGATQGPTDGDAVIGGHPVTGRFSQRPKRRNLRVHVFARDHGVCAECGIDTTENQQAYRDAIAESVEAGKAYKESKWERYRAVFGDMKARTGPEPDAFFNQELLTPEWQRLEECRQKVASARLVGTWEADHITPLVDGGEDSLENLRTLCAGCHAKVTQALARRQWEALPPDEQEYRRQFFGGSR